MADANRRMPLALWFEHVPIVSGLDNAIAVDLQRGGVATRRDNLHGTTSIGAETLRYQ